jgi:hypothetical protein
MAAAPANSPIGGLLLLPWLWSLRLTTAGGLVVAAGSGAGGVGVGVAVGRFDVAAGCAPDGVGATGAAVVRTVDGDGVRRAGDVVRGGGVVLGEVGQIFE